MKTRFWKQDWFFGAVATVLLLCLALFGALRPLEWWAYDVGMQFSADRKASDRLVIVALDDRAVERFGPWPWPPGIFADFFAKLHQGSAPAAVGILPPFDFPVNEQGLDYIRRLRALGGGNLSADAARLLIQAESTLDDTQDLAASMAASGNVVLAMPQRIAGPAKGPPIIPPVLVEHRLRAVSNRPLSAPSLLGVSYRLPLFSWNQWLPGPPDVQQPPTAIPVTPQLLLADSVAGVGFLAREAERTGVREQPLVYRHRGLYLPSFSLIMAARAIGLDNNHIDVRLERGVYLGERFIPTDARLQVWPYFYARDVGSPFETYSIVDVLDGAVDPSVFANRTVLVGPTTPRLVALYDTPVGEELPPVLVEAHVISSLLNGYVYDVGGWALVAQLLAFLLVGLYLMFGLPRLRHVTGAVTTLIFAALLANLEFILMNSLGLRAQFVAPILALLLGHAGLAMKHLLEGRVGAFQAELADVRLRLGEVYQSQGHLELAFDMYNRCPTTPDLLQQLFNLGLDFERRRKFARAVTTFKYILQRAPDYPEVGERIRRVQELEKQYILSGGRADPIETAVLDGSDITRPVIGRFEIERIIGRGAMGVVYRGRDTRIGRTVAIKTLALAQEFEGKKLEETQQRFFREAETAGKLNHPNIVTIYDVGEEHDLSYIAMDFLTGDNLRKYCDTRSRLPVTKVLDMAAQVAEALDYAHGHGVVHRDVKPANIIYDEATGTIKVTDFGVAALTNVSNTKTGT
ncbi:MAG TPA: CHASE2 domain-containing protein, partial [Gammaproteobacteria bacterium]|nr:CHASE2 domain-containing protein [Gammaproteobacteria bacterium]